MSSRGSCLRRFLFFGNVICAVVNIGIALTTTGGWSLFALLIGALNAFVALKIMEAP